MRKRTQKKTKKESDENEKRNEEQNNENNTYIEQEQNKSRTRTKIYRDEYDSIGAVYTFEGNLHYPVQCSITKNNHEVK